MYKNDKVIRRYSESFKLKIVQRLAAGEHDQLGDISTLLNPVVVEEIKRQNS